MLKIDGIKTKKDFVSFVSELSEDFINDPESWENNNLGTFLKALAAWVDDSDGYYINQGKQIPERPDWQMVADMLIAAKFYE